MRRKRRYLVFEIDGGLSEARRAAVALTGRLGVDKSEVKVILVDEISGKGLLRCSLDQMAALKRIITSKDPPIRILGASGTIRAAKRKYFSDKAKIPD